MPTPRSMKRRQTPTDITAATERLRELPRGAGALGWFSAVAEAMAFLQVAPSHGLVQTCGNQLPREQKHKMADAMADPVATRPRIRRSPGRVALKFVSRLIRPTIVTGMMAALIAPADTPTVLPLTCRITVTRVGGAWIYEPDCSHQSPPSPPSPNGPPSGPGTPPGAPSTP
jgi:hypothetical protein